VFPPTQANTQVGQQESLKFDCTRGNSFESTSRTSTVNVYFNNTLSILTQSAPVNRPEPHMRDLKRTTVNEVQTKLVVVDNPPPFFCIPNVCYCVHRTPSWASL